MTNISRSHLYVSFLSNRERQTALRHAPLDICSGKLKVKVTLEVQTIKWLLARVNIINENFGS